MRIKVVSYASPNYMTHAAKLVDSCNRWGLDCEVTKVPAFKNWHQGVSYKPDFIRRSIDTFSDHDGILWIDADAYVVRPLPIGDCTGADIAASQFQWSPAHKLEILTGTMFFATNDRVRLLVDDWQRETKKYTGSDTPEQDALIPLIHGYRNIISFVKLSIEWTWIDDERVKQQFPKAIPLIVHTQASRQVRAEEFRRDQIKGA